MQAQRMVRPSNFLNAGIVLEQFGDVQLFKFSEALHERRHELLEKHKQAPLNPDEAAEYAGICDLDRIFTRINAQLAAAAQWCPLNPDNSPVTAPSSAVNIATPPNI
ncbi:hypothetical protein PN441_07220 [Spirulina major CS-329]|uniref:hypothetical protein n=1 Tax=Spirulina TaxID=1154 RepID=UPI00232BAD2A|nr:MULTISPECIES: hypothetical protein [Spirulina]MDB9496346.1 hypothetical protein [Spirulina subsalsa CS-330]MDB9502857.1 hypothetical protein [Spirulina major CS-329]